MRGLPYSRDGLTFTDHLRTRLIARSVVRCLPASETLRVLDLGCGFHAVCLQAISSRLAEGVGIDFDISEQARRCPNLHFILDSVESALPTQPDAAFDAVLALSVIEHLEEPITCLRHCHRLLKPGGVLIVHVPTWRAKPVLELWCFGLGKDADELDDHKMYYAKRDLWPLLVAAGFKPSGIKLKYQSLGLTLFASAVKQSLPKIASR